MKNKFIIVIIFIILLKVSTWFLPFTRDAFGYAYIGASIANGDIPYLGVWDHKPPGIFFANAIIFNLFSDYLLGIRLAGIAFAIVSFFLFYKLLTLFFDKTVSFISSFLFIIFSNVYMITQGENMVEHYMLPIIIFVYYMFVRGIHSDKKKYIYLVGIGIGALFLFKQVGILPFFPIFLYLLIKRKLHFLLNILSGIFIVILPVGIYFILNNATLEAIEGIFTYNFSYSRQGYTLPSIGQSMYYIIQVVLATLLFWVLGVIGLFRKKYSSIDLLFVFFLAFSLIGVGLGGKFAFTRNYFLLTLPALGYFVAVTIDELIHQIRKNISLKKNLIIFFLGLLFPSLILQFQSIFAGLYFQKIFHLEKTEAMYLLGLSNFNFIEDEEVFYKIVDYLKPKVGTEKYILDFGAEPEIYLLTKTYSPTRFFYNFPINGVFIKDDNYKNRRKIFLQEISNNRPTFIILNDIRIRHQSSFEDLDFREFKDFIKKDYIQDAKIGNFILFKLRSLNV